jgi:hypothetical protein
MARKWTNLNLAGALHYLTGNLSKAMKEMGWYSFEKRR